MVFCGSSVAALVKQKYSFTCKELQTISKLSETLCHYDVSTDTAFKILSGNVYTVVYLYVFVELHWIPHATVVEAKVEVHTCPSIIHLCYPGNQYNNNNYYYPSEKSMRYKIYMLCNNQRVQMDDWRKWTGGKQVTSEDVLCVLHSRRDTSSMAKRSDWVGMEGERRYP